MAGINHWFGLFITHIIFNNYLLSSKGIMHSLILRSDFLMSPRPWLLSTSVVLKLELKVLSKHSLRGPPLEVLIQWDLGRCVF